MSIPSNSAMMKPDFIFCDPIRAKASLLPFPVDVIKHIFSYLNNLDLQKGLTVSYLWCFNSLTVIKTKQWAMLEDFADFLQKQPQLAGFTLLLPKKEEFERTNLTFFMQNLKDKLLEKLQNLTREEIQQLAIDFLCAGYLDRLGLLNALVGIYPKDSRFRESLINKELFLVVSNQDLTSSLSVENFHWLRLISEIRKGKEVLPGSTKLTVAATLQLRTAKMMEKQEAADFTRLNSISKKIAKAAKKKIPIKCQAMTALAMKLSALANQSPLPATPVLEGFDVSHLPLLFENVFLLAMISKEIENIQDRVHSCIKYLTICNSFITIESGLEEIKISSVIYDLPNLVMLGFSNLVTIKWLNKTIDRFLDKGYLTIKDREKIRKKLKAQEDRIPPKPRELMMRIKEEGGSLSAENYDQMICKYSQIICEYFQDFSSAFTSHPLTQADLRRYLKNFPYVWLDEKDIETLSHLLTQDYVRYYFKNSVWPDKKELERVILLSIEMFEIIQEDDSIAQEDGTSKKSSWCILS